MMRDTRPRTRILIQIRILIKVKYPKHSGQYYIDIKINLMAGVTVISFGIEV